MKSLNHKSVSLLLLAGVTLCSCGDDDPATAPEVTTPDAYSVTLTTTSTEATTVKGLAADGASQISITVAATGDYKPSKIEITPEQGWGLIDGTVLEADKAITDSDPKADSDGYYRYLLRSQEVLPAGLSASSVASLSFDVTLTTEQEKQYSSTLKVDVVRTPTIFAHGIWSNSTTYDPILNYIRPKGLFIDEGLYALDYSATCSDSYETNKMVIPNAIDYVKANYLTAGYVTEKATLVGHSMGGALIREYIQNDFGTLPYRDDISSIIFIDTVHSGSQLADFALQIERDFPDSPLAAVGKMGAIIDLAVTSDATQRLNSADNLNKVKLPMHAITSTINTLPNIANLVASKQYFEAIAIYILDDLFLKDIFNGDDNDIVVPEQSQIGGLPDGFRYDYITSYSDQWHCSVLISEQTAIDILSLIEDPTASSDKFYEDGLNPSQLSYTDHTFNMVNDITAKESSDRMMLGFNNEGKLIEMALDDSTLSDSSTIYYLSKDSADGKVYFYKETK